MRAQRGDGSYGLFDIELHNRLDDPVIQGVVVVSRSLPDPQPADAPSMPAEVAATVQLGAGDHLPIGLLLLDSEGDVVRPALLWNDTRSTGDAETLVEGMRIARRIIEKHGGTLRFETSAKGTVFRVVLPVAANA